MGHYEDSGNQARASREETESDFSNSRIASQVAYMNDQIQKAAALFSELENRLDLVLVPEQADPMNSVNPSGAVPKKIASELSYTIDELNNQLGRLQSRIANVIQRVQL